MTNREKLKEVYEMFVRSREIMESVLVVVQREQGKYSDGCYCGSLVRHFKEKLEQDSYLLDLMITGNYADWGDKAYLDLEYKEDNE